MIRIAQNDPRWGKTLIGKSKSTIAGHGCLITSLAMLWSKFYGNKSYIRPDEIATRWTFVAVEGDKDPKYLLWSSVNDGMKFIWRNFGYSPTRLMDDPVTHLVDTEAEILKKYMNSQDYGVVFRVQTATGGEHWMTGWKWGWLGKPVCHDPNGGGIRYNPFGFLSKYPRCTGWTLIRKTK